MGVSQLTLEQMLRRDGYDCECGRKHFTDVQRVELRQGAIDALPDCIAQFGVKKPYVVCDVNTYKAAGERVCAILAQNGTPYTLYVIPRSERIEPDELALGQITMSFDPDCDFIIAVGGGVINDMCKMLARASGRRTMVVGTAPSMDGYCSNSASVIWGGIKSTIYTPCPCAVIADVDIMRQAPMLMLQSGLGDVIGKYISVCEWRLAHEINGEYFCPELAQMMRIAVAKCVAAAPGLPARDPGAVRDVAEGLIISGIAMAYAKVSRPASGLEHYFSHIFDMCTLEKGMPGSLHGIQVGIGTVLALMIYDRLRTERPDKQRALSHAAAFDRAAWESEMRRVFGKTAENVIAIENTAGKNDPAKHAARIDTICSRWDDLLAIMRDELPSADEVIAALRSANAPIYPADIGIGKEETRDALVVSREIRDKYIASSLLWDMGVLEEYADWLVSKL